MTRILEAATNAVWAMEESALERLFAIAERSHEVTPEALEAYRAESLKRAERASIRDGVAIIDASGPLFKRANLFDAMSGATSYEIIRRDFQAALDDKAVKAILFNIDSPGGEANGVAELSQAIFDARGQKPIQAYIGGMGASAAYWLPSATDRITIDPTALVGSIGVQMTMRDSSAAEEKRGIKTYRFVSSQSPMKNIGPDTQEGEAAIRQMIDSMAGVFVGAVARNRGVATETVLKDFGKGGIFVGKDAVKAGLADSLGSFESVLADLAATGRKSTRNKGTSMSETHDKPAASASAEDIAAAVAKAVGEAQASERTRIGALNRIAAAHGVAAEVLTAAIEGNASVADFALQVADVTARNAADAKTKVLEGLKADEAKAALAGASGGTEPGELTEREQADKLADEMIAAARAAGVAA